MNPTDSSSGVVCALPTTNAPAPSTMNVSVIVPPASIARTRGWCGEAMPRPSHRIGTTGVNLFVRADGAGPALAALPEALLRLTAARRPLPAAGGNGT